jgi:hypothetical protein
MQRSRELKLDFTLTLFPSAQSYAHPASRWLRRYILSPPLAARRVAIVSATEVTGSSVHTDFLTSPGFLSTDLSFATDFPSNFIEEVNAH